MLRRWWHELKPHTAAVRTRLVQTGDLVAPSLLQRIAPNVVQLCNVGLVEACATRRTATSLISTSSLNRSGTSATAGGHHKPAFQDVSRAREKQITVHSLASCLVAASDSDTSTLPSVYIKRDDLLHPVISGNKWRKLQGHLAMHLSCSTPGIVSFGGAFSNHVHALAWVCNALSVPLVLFIRGERPACLSPTLQDAVSWGARVHFLSRQEYSAATHASMMASLLPRPGCIRVADVPVVSSIAAIAGIPSEFQVVPEGGGGILGQIGCVELADELECQIKDLQLACSDRESGSGIPRVRLVLPAGTGTTLAGLIASCNAAAITEICGVCVLKAYHSLDAEVAAMVADNDNVALQHIRCTDSECELAQDASKQRYEHPQRLPHCRWTIKHDYHGGGYARALPGLTSWAHHFSAATGVPLDIVYTAKGFAAGLHLSNTPLFQPASVACGSGRVEAHAPHAVILLHTGGLQGNRSLQ